MRFYNTLGRQVQDFKPLKDGSVKLYTCGPTVYDYAHIGNLRSFVFDDLIRRAMQTNGYQVRHVMNITDVGHLVSDMDEGEDKLEKGAARENKSAWEVAQFFINAFKDDAASLNLLVPNAYKGKDGPYARATDFIGEQIEIIKTLHEKSFAYITDQAIYFDTQRLSDYGKLTGQKLTDKEIGARQEVVSDKNKHHPQDFALWFFKKGRFADHIMAWNSPWGEGFPGWHLECSAIIHATLGEPLDIHTGGVDHIGTHHTNEIAQTEAAFDTELSKFWIHNEHLLVDGQKMSKSSGNFYTLKDIKDRGYEPLALRLLFLQAHYRSQMNFTWEALDGAQAFFNRLQAWADLQFQLSADSKAGADDYDEAIKEIKRALADDLNSPMALSIISSLVTTAEEKGIDHTKFKYLLDQIDEMLGLGLSDRQDVSDQIKELMEQREQARQSQNWHEADSLRQNLLEQKVEISDTPAGQIWRRLS